MVNKAPPGGSGRLCDFHCQVIKQLLLLSITLLKCNTLDTKVFYDVTISRRIRTFRSNRFASSCFVGRPEEKKKKPRMWAIQPLERLQNHGAVCARPPLFSIRVPRASKVCDRVSLSLRLCTPAGPRLCDRYFRPRVFICCSHRTQRLAC